MWGFGKKVNLRDAGIFNGFTDWHSHILPGVDDGIPAMEQSLAVLEEYEKLGFKRVWLTPHIMEDCPNETEHLRNRFAELKENWKGNVEIRLASENMLDNLFEDRLEKKDFLPIGDDGSHLLVETSYFTPPFGMDDMLEAAMKAGYHLILAHPERYRYMEEEDYIKLKEKGLIFQMNLLSLVGAYGETARKKAEWLLEKGMINLLGSDLHRLEMFKNNTTLPIKKKNALNKVKDVASQVNLS